MKRIVTQGETMFPILQVLAEAPGPLPFKTIVERALEKMGLGVDCMEDGPLGPKDVPRVYQRFANGGFELRSKGCIPKGSRSWTISDRGREALRTGVLPPKLAEGEAVPAPQGAETPSENEPVPEKVEPPEKMPRGDDWVSDPHLSVLIASNTACFGTYEPGNKVCAACPLKVRCAGALSSILTTLAQGIKSDVEKRPLLKPRAVQELRETVVNALGSEDDKGVSFERVFPAPYDGVCETTGETFSQGTLVRYEPGSGYSIVKEAG